MECALELALCIHCVLVFDTITCAEKSTDVGSALQSLNAQPTERVKELCADLHHTLGPASLFLTIATGAYNFSCGRLLKQAMTQCSTHHRRLAFLEVHHTVHGTMQVRRGPRFQAAVGELRIV